MAQRGETMQPRLERKSAPYAPPSNVVDIIRRYRERNLPEIFDVSLLGDIGISKGNIHRALSALRFLGLIDETGAPMATFDAIQTATDAEYPTVLKGIVTKAYEEVFRNIDPSKDSQEIIANHFRRYQPASQRERMVVLFLALCREAGIATLDVPRKMSRRGTQSKSAEKVWEVPITIRHEEGQELERTPLTVGELRRQYIATLIEMARRTSESHSEVNFDLLDRIEKLLAEEEERKDNE